MDTDKAQTATGLTTPRGRRIQKSMSAARSLAVCWAVLVLAAQGWTAETEKIVPLLLVHGLPEPFRFSINYPAMAAATLGPDSARLSEAERTEFTECVSELINLAFLRTLAMLHKHEVEMVADEQRPDGLILRRFQTRSNQSDERVDFRMLLSGKEGQWSVQDLITDEVSLVSSFRSQFRKILQKEGFPALIVKMKAKIEKEWAEKIASVAPEQRP